ncbi:MAG: glycosyltransferase family 10, partial [Candidatus Thiodiazotropha sp.]
QSKTWFSAIENNFFDKIGRLRLHLPIVYLKFNRCDVTKDRTELNNSRAILFHADDLWENRQSLLATLYNPVVPLPTHRNTNQVWVLWSVEPVCHLFGDAPPHVFNWTAHYRRDSTIFIPYATYLKKSTSATNSNHNGQSGPLINYFASKTKMAVTVASNCRVPSRRYRIIRELSKFVDIDEFGSCTGHVVCPKNRGKLECDKYVIDYKFYLAFENSYCRDYISEKFWRALERNQIPVIAASDASLELLPNNSYLNVFDFPTMKDLANRMIEIGNDEQLYNSFFLWKKDHVKDEEHAFCKLCRALHENRTHQSYHDLEGWITYDSCSKPSVSILYY